MWLPSPAHGTAKSSRPPCTRVTQVRPDLAEVMILPEADRFREEDPFTDQIAAAVPSRMITPTSRFEVDLNRPRREAVYRTPADAWDLDLWRDEALPDEAWRGSLPSGMRCMPRSHRGWTRSPTAGPSSCSTCTPTTIAGVVRSAGPEPLADNPDVNVGTGSVDRSRFGRLVERFVRDMADPPSSAAGRWTCART
jgi:N-formylglutamate deformylase